MSRRQPRVGDTVRVQGESHKWRVEAKRKGLLNVVALGAMPGIVIEDLPIDQAEVLDSFS